MLQWTLLQTKFPKMEKVMFSEVIVTCSLRSLSKKYHCPWYSGGKRHSDRGEGNISVKPYICSSTKSRKTIFQLYLVHGSEIRIRVSRDYYLHFCYNELSTNTCIHVVCYFVRLYVCYFYIACVCVCSFIRLMSLRLRNNIMLDACIICIIHTIQAVESTVGSTSGPTRLDERLHTAKLLIQPVGPTIE